MGSRGSLSNRGGSYKHITSGTTLRYVNAKDAKKGDYVTLVDDKGPMGGAAYNWAQQMLEDKAQKYNRRISDIEGTFKVVDERPKAVKIEAKVYKYTRGGQDTVDEREPWGFWMPRNAFIGGK